LKFELIRKKEKKKKKSK